MDGDIDVIDTSDCSSALLADTGLDPDGFGPNDLGFDKLNRRVYFATVAGGCPGTASEPYFYDVIDGSVTMAGTLAGCPTDADFDSGPDDGESFEFRGDVSLR